MPSSKSTGAPSCCATALRKASRRLTQLYDDALAPSGLRSTQLSILSALSEPGRTNATQSELAQALVLDRSTLGHNLRPLERDGLIRLAPGQDDRRQRCVSLTPKGKTALRSAGKYWQLAQARFLAVYGEEKAQLLGAALVEIAQDERLARLGDPPDSP